jgi:hypothetical protein
MRFHTRTVTRAVATAIGDAAGHTRPRPSVRTHASPRSTHHAPSTLFCVDHYRRPSVLCLSTARRAPLALSNWQAERERGKPNASCPPWSFILGDDNSLDSEGDDLFATPASSLSSLGPLLRRSGGRISHPLVACPRPAVARLAARAARLRHDALRLPPHPGLGGRAALHALRGARRTRCAPRSPRRSPASARARRKKRRVRALRSIGRWRTWRSRTG